MQPMTTYGTLTPDQLREELILTSAALATEWTELGALCADQHSDYLSAYARSPGSSVAAKNREAEYNCVDQTRDILNSQARMNSLTIRRDLIVFFLMSRQPGKLPFDSPSFDPEWLATVG